MDLITLALAQAFAKATPGTAAAYAAAAQESAEAAAASAASVTPSNEDDVAWITDGAVTNTYAPATDVISGTAVSITAVENHRYVCADEVLTLSITPAANGVTDVLFKSGSTPTVLTVPNDVVWVDWFNPSALQANVVYELSIIDGKYGTVGIWAS